MPSALPAFPTREQQARASFIHLRVGIVRMRAQCRTAAATIAELREATATAVTGRAVPRTPILNRVNHDMGALARTSAEVHALRALASPAMVRDLETIGRSRDALEHELENVAERAGDLRVVRRSESITVTGADRDPLAATALVSTLEIKTAVFRIADLRPSAGERPPVPWTRPRRSDRFTLRDIAAAFLSIRLLARGA